MNQTEESPFSAPMPETQQLPVNGPTSGLAIASFVLGILSLFLLCFTGIFGAILGIIALLKINRSNGQLKGQGLAVAGLSLSVIMSFFVTIPLLIGLLLPALQKAREKARQQLEVREMQQQPVQLEKHSSSDGDTRQTYSWSDEDTRH